MTDHPQRSNSKLCKKKGENNNPLVFQKTECGGFFYLCDYKKVLIIAINPKDKTETTTPTTVNKSVLRAKVDLTESSPAVINRYPEYRPIATDVRPTNHENQLSKPVMVLIMFAIVTRIFYAIVILLKRFLI